MLQWSPDVLEWHGRIPKGPMIPRALNIFYRILHSTTQRIRSKNYKQYRHIVEWPFVHRILFFIFGTSYKRITTPENYSLFIHPVYHGNFLSEEMIANYEPNLRKALELLVQPSMTIYDIGANVGVFSLFLLSKAGRNGKVYAFEPEENNYKCLMRTKNANGLDNLYVQTMGVGDISGVQSFDRRGGAFSGHLVDDVATAKMANVLSVNAVSVDDFVLRQGNPPPDVVKMDVEGNELRVVGGMKSVLQQYKPAIICELHEEINRSVLEIHPILSKSSYRCYNLNDWISGEAEPVRSFKGLKYIVALPD